LATGLPPNVTYAVTITSDAKNVEVTFLPPILESGNRCGLRDQIAET
jgi:hypothetical protein